MTENWIRVGYGRKDISPETPVPLGGYGNPTRRISQELRDKLMATCIAFTDCNDNTVLLFTTDNIRANPALGRRVRELIEEEFGLPQSHVMIAATHSHSTPDTHCTEMPEITAYNEKYVSGLVEAARAALADRAPALIYVSTVQTERMNFIRHYKMADGTYSGANFGDWNRGVVGHASCNDPWIQMVKFVRPGTKDILLMNWQAHPCFTGGIDKLVCSSDYIGEVRKYLEMKTGARFAFFQGAAGNQNGVSFYDRETRTRDAAEYGQLLGDYALQALEQMRQLKGNEVSITQRVLDLPLDHSDDHLAEQCRDIWAEWQKNFDRVASNKRAKEIGQNSIYAVSGVLSRTKLPQSEEMPVYAFHVGDLGFACAPYEMFCVSGTHIKEYSPYVMTFVVSCCNDGRAYLASDLAFAHGCYEVDTRRYPRGTAEKLADTFVEMLRELKA